MREEKENIFNVPNLLTFLRMSAGIVFSGALFANYPKIILFAIFFAGALTDFFDGFLARKFNQVTRLGKLLDVVADRSIFILALASLMVYSFFRGGFAYFSLNFFIAAGLLLPREVLGLAGIIILLIRKKRIFVLSDLINKLTGFMQYMTLGFIILNLEISFYSAAVTFATGLIAGINYIAKSCRQQ